MNYCEIADKSTKFTPEVAENLASVFFDETMQELPEQVRKALISIYKILGLDYKTSLDLLIAYKSNNEFFIKNDNNRNWEITPYYPPFFDLQCIEDIINKCSDPDIFKLAPAFDALGFILRKGEDNKYSLHFVGSENYEVWKDIGDTYYTIDSENDNLDWFSGVNWPDGINLETKKFNWTEDNR